MSYHHPSEIMDEIARLTSMFAGVSYDRLDQPTGLQWPVPTATQEGTALMHRETFPKGKAHFVAVEYLPPGEAPSKEYPFVLTTGRIFQHYNCGAPTRRTDILELVDTDVLEMHPADMAALHLRDGEIVRVVSARGDALPLPGRVNASFRGIFSPAFTSLLQRCRLCSLRVWTNAQNARSIRSLPCTWNRLNGKSSIRKMKRNSAICDAN